MTKLVSFINTDNTSNATVRFATLSEYMALLKADVAAHNGTSGFLPRFENLDFEYGWPRLLPQRNGNHSLQYTTGALSSRARFKQLIRQVGALQRAAEIAFVLQSISRNQSDMKQALNASSLLSGRKALALVQHHDAVTGTMFKNNSMDSLDCCQRCKMAAFLAPT